MAEINYIREETNKKGRSYSSVAKQMNRDRRTIKKYSEMEDFNPEEQPVQIRTARVMDPVKPIIDQWLLEDMGKKKKFRRTAKRIYDLLVTECVLQDKSEEECKDKYISLPAFNLVRNARTVPFRRLYRCA
ncbi:hypothetical protein BEP19_00510 [Ammoniphilus oxalaticus]|uniref:HTH IS21-type domain-containing protein n=1 Tax=Ammoniphilus oxalaticus TaxID=66863 RepID=A0A419SRC6_9BACL|nr:hypothetical protein BEP19_00510 [Ammoniphilus oxalaticus]